MTSHLMPCCRAGKGRRARGCLGEARAGPDLAWNRPLHCLYHNHSLVMLLTRLHITYSCWRSHYISRHASTLPRPPPLASLTTQEDMKVARGWIAAYEQTRAEDFPRGECPTLSQPENIRPTPPSPNPSLPLLSHPPRPHPAPFQTPSKSVTPAPPVPAVKTSTNSPRKRPSACPSPRPPPSCPLTP